MKTNKPSKSDIIISWSIAILLMAVYGLCVWVYHSTKNGGFWAKYGQNISIGIFIIILLIYIVSAIIETIKYFYNKKKGD